MQIKLIVKKLLINNKLDNKINIKTIYIKFLKSLNNLINNIIT